MSDIFDGDEPDTPEPEPIDYGQLWRDYSTWEQDITERYDRDLKDLDVSYRMGRGISPEAYAGERARLQGAQQQELRDLQAGPTYQQLMENWQNEGSPGDITTFYGGPVRRERRAPGSIVAEGAPSPRRGVSDEAIGALGEALLERENATWYYV